MPHTPLTVRPALSVVMAVYNGEEYVRLAIESVIEQTFDSFEFIIIDDCSTDRTPEVLLSYGDPRIVYRRNEENLGQTESLNLGLELAQGEFIARIDADDAWYPRKLEEQYRYMVGHPDVAVCGTWADRIDARGEITGTLSPPTDPSDIRFRMLRASPVCHVSVLMRRQVIAESGGYAGRFRYAADYDLWSRLLRDGHKLVNLPARLTQFREMPHTFGTAAKVGPAGDESADIVQSNAALFAGLDLDLKECRDIALLFFPEADVAPQRVAKAYGNLRLMAEAVYGSPPMRVRLELLAVLGWSLFKRQAHLRMTSAHSVWVQLGEVEKAFRGHLIEALVAVAAIFAATFAAGAGRALKTSVTTSLAWLRRALR